MSLITPNLSWPRSVFFFVSLDFDTVHDVALILPLSLLDSEDFSSVTEDLSSSRTTTKSDYSALTTDSGNNSSINNTYFVKINGSGEPDSSGNND